MREGIKTVHKIAGKKKTNIKQLSIEDLTRSLLKGCVVDAQ